MGARFSSRSAHFTSADVGKQLLITGATNVRNNKRYTIASVIDEHTVEFLPTDVVQKEPTAGALQWQMMIGCTIEASETVQDCTGGIPLVMAGAGQSCNHAFENDSAFNLYNQFNWDVIQHLGTQVIFHFSGNVTSQNPAAVMAVRMHIGGDTVFGIPGVVVWTFNLTAGTFKLTSPAMALPTGLKKIRFSAQSSPFGTMAIERAVLALEII